MLGLGLVVCWGCVGCKVGPDYTPPQPPAPDAWHVELINGLEAGPREASGWWESFGDEKLNHLILLAEGRNHNLQIAVSRIEEARAKYGAAAADLWPGATVGGLIQRRRVPQRQLVSEIVPNSDYIASLDIDWEIDLFGRIRRSIESAEAEVQATIEDWRDVLVLIRAEVASSYIAARALQLEADILRQSIRFNRETLDLVTQKYEAGVANDLQLARARADLGAVESKLPGVETDIAMSINRISVLIGEPPGQLRVGLSGPGRLPSPPARIAVGIPADVVRQRPDIRAAERRLASKTAAIGVATANLYPRFRLNGWIGFESTSFNGWFDGDNWTGGLGPSMIWPAFSGGKLLEGVNIADQQTRQALLKYEQTVLSAFEEVENALIAYANSVAAKRLLEETVYEYERVVALSSQRYAAGTEDLESLLLSQRLLLNAREALVKAEGQSAVDVVTLYRSLGGDWQTPPEPTPEAGRDHDDTGDEPDEAPDDATGNTGLSMLSVSEEGVTERRQP